MPGDFAEGANRLASERNLRAYEDPLGWRDPAHLRSRRPQATTEAIVRGAGVPNGLVNITAGAVGIVGGLGTVVSVLSLADQFHDIFEGGGRIQVELRGLRPSDYPVTYEFNDVPLGNQTG